MKKTLKGPATAFFVLSLIFVVAWVAVFALHGLLGYNFDFTQFTDSWLKPRIDALLPFFKGESYGFTPDNPNFYWTYIGFGVLGLMLIFMIVGLALSISRKRARYLWFGLIMLLAAVAAFEFVLFYNHPLIYVHH